jgi:hypothetical protein
MASITIVSGGLGTGTTTLAKALAHAEPMGLHCVTAPLSHFPAHPLDPTPPEAHAQNTTSRPAIGRAAAAFAEGGDEVCLDGVVGPWFLPMRRRAGDAVARVADGMLRATLAEAWARVLRRDGPGTSARVHAMPAPFADLAGYEQHTIDPTGRPVAEVRAECLQRRHRRECVLDSKGLIP